MAGSRPQTIEVGQNQSASRSDPQSVLSAWTVFEVLSPAPFTESKNCVRLDREALPWSLSSAGPNEKRAVFYQVVLGTVKTGPAMRALIECYGEKSPELREPSTAQSVLACVTLDHEGRPVPSPAVAVSSFGWGLPVALSVDLAKLADWTKHEQRLVDGLDETIRTRGSDGEIQPLDKADIERAYCWLTTALALPKELVCAPRVAVKITARTASSQPPEPQGSPAGRVDHDLGHSACGGA